MGNSGAVALSAVLWLVHAALVVVGAAGLLEMVWAGHPWPPLSDPLFPPWLLVVQWTVMVAAGATYLALHRRRRQLPWAMLGAYGVLAAVCAVETFGFMQHSGRFSAFAVECATYVALLGVLFYRAGGLGRQEVTS